ncbi:MAG: DUF6932 family protein [Brevundimonas sp.]
MPSHTYGAPPSHADKDGAAADIHSFGDGSPPPSSARRVRRQGFVGPSADALRHLLVQAYQRIRNSGFSPFPDGERRATPLSAFPFHLRLRDLDADWGYTPQRADLARNVHRLIGRVADTGVAPYALLIGGSFADRTVDAPRDVDLVMFYTGVAEDARLTELQITAKKTHLIDCRLIPVDGDPLIVIRASVFFGLLYSKREGSMVITRPPLYVDLVRKTPIDF